ncbi:unnamed protein product [Mytilus coruscus]|uniref:Chromo domain-containing protein n=1 Tax=Mytilus coruscus TaxID=42192 RepID=A0A6J8CED0_MYTCO|nr:unnamed protein product [Mytilus coruscus]
MSSLNYEDYLHKIWYDPKQAAAFTGSDKLYNIVKQEGKIKIGRHKIKQWLQNQKSYSLSRNNVHKFKRSRYVVDTIDSLWEMDLAQLDKFQTFNSGYNFLLFVIYCFSKFLWIQPIMDKTHTSVLNALKTIMSGNRKPTSIRSDLGKEFKNQYVRKYLPNQGINTYYSLNDTKCAIVERSIRSLKSILFSLYKVVDLQNEEIEGSFQDSEVQKVRKDSETKWKIEKVIKRRKRNGTKQVLVRWLGYPKKFDSWVPVSDIQNE